jgi:hypothetical protein
MASNRLRSCVRCRKHPQCKRHHNDDRGHHQEHLPVERDGAEARERGWQRRDDRWKQRKRDHHAKRSPCPGNHEPLGQELAGDAAASSAKRRSHRELLVTPRRARELEVHDVDDCNEQEHRRGADGHHEDGACIAGDALREPLNDGGGAGIHRGMLVTEPAHERVKLARRRVSRGAVAEPAHHPQVAAGAARPLLRGVAEGAIDARRGIDDVVERRRKHPHDDRLCRAEVDGAADDGGVAGKPLHPEPVRDDHHVVRVGRVVLGEEVAAERGADAKGAEELPAHAQSAQPLGVAVAEYGGLPRAEGRAVLE